MRNKKWVRLLAYVTGSVSQELLLQNEYLAAENRILKGEAALEIHRGRHRDRQPCHRDARLPGPDCLLWRRFLGHCPHARPPRNGGACSDPSSAGAPRIPSEEAALAMASRGHRAS